jgi:hypothetical protein
MNLDRFAYGLRQSCKTAGECRHCGAELYKGDEVIQFEGDWFCDAVCLGEHLLEITDYDEVIL